MVCLAPQKGKILNYGWDLYPKNSGSKHVISEITERGILKYSVETTYLIEFFVIDSTNILYKEGFFKFCFISKL